MGFPGGHQPLPFYRPPEEAGPPGFPPEPTLPGWDLQQNKSHKPHMPPGSPGSDVLQALELVAPGAAQQVCSAASPLRMEGS